MFWCNSCNSESQFPMPRWLNSTLFILYNCSNDCIGKQNEAHFLTSLIIIYSYKLQIQVKDHTGIASFVLFDKDAEKIIQKTAMELSSKVSNLNS